MSSKNKTVRVTIAGKRNAGKSTLLNALAGKNRAITEDLPGLTRDILEVEIKDPPMHYILCDTPGLDIEYPDSLETEILERAKIHLEFSDLIIVVMESPSPSDFDAHFMNLLRKSKIHTPVIYTVNKIDGPDVAGERLLPFYEEGFTDLIPVSAKNKWNLDVLKKKMSETVPEIVKTTISRSGKKEISTVISDTQDSCIKIAIVGKPNAGKSSLFNKLIRKELSIVSDLPGTTRDTVDSIFHYNKNPIRIIDTAGLRKEAKVIKSRNNAEYFSMKRTERAIQDADVVIHLIDAQQGITDLDKKISSKIREEGRPSIIAVNKWDLMEKETDSVKNYTDRMKFQFPQIKHIPVIFISAQSGQRLNKLLDHCMDLKERSEFRITTSRLNEIVEKWNRSLHGVTARNSKIFYATQSSISPPEFVLFVRNKEKIATNITGFFENKIYADFNLTGVPVKIFIREK
ncbi:MAG: ribosome biogenesis GTPase Der [Spirochaetia bacterium]|nr:ribosome biogenesis GTPase Der [Spirochaetia bacterium]